MIDITTVGKFCLVNIISSIVLSIAVPILMLVLTPVFLTAVLWIWPVIGCILTYKFVPAIATILNSSIDYVKKKSPVFVKGFSIGKCCSWTCGELGTLSVPIFALAKIGSLLSAEFNDIREKELSKLKYKHPLDWVMTPTVNKSN